MKQDRLIKTIDTSKAPWCRKTKAEMLAEVREYGHQLQFASDEFRGDRDVVLAAVRQSGWALKYASEELKCEMAECWAKCMEQEVKNEL
jgi:hypothetical protein